ncbi:MAG: hypothetical protein Athens101410_614 [Parcubacteria group bacterium Athens1014_10]|nr:MAG: hypothetical protein Athens101410_614 [Parcubacteria group bacterium Athens1014_10]TSD04800.1 MAG: hypothetical protein Athens071412_584 [Parcubacteria group bacterium Athens0714_12]
MTRPLRIEYPGAIYHITSRGNAKQIIFQDDLDRGNFFRVLSLVIERFNWICHSYCLMDNHYHLIIETPEGNLSRGMRQLNGVYTQSFNTRHNKVGHLFQGRYKAILVDKDSYLLSLCRYVVLNPLRAGLVKWPQDWRWSSYMAIIGEVKKPCFLTVDWILFQFGSNKIRAREQYKQFIFDGIKEDSPWKDLKGQILLGADNFIEKFKDILKDKERLKEVPRAQRYVLRPTLDELFTEKILKDKELKKETIYQSYVYYGYILKEIADYLGIHYVTVSRVIKQVEKKKNKK